jgi:hypothetical protein
MISVILTLIGLVAMFQGMYWLALLAFFLAISIRGTLVVGFFVGLVLLLSGCAQFTETKNIYIDNTAVNNYVGNPCAFYVGDHCIVMKKITPRNPDYPK